MSSTTVSARPLLADAIKASQICHDTHGCTLYQAIRQEVYAMTSPSGTAWNKYMAIKPTRATRVPTRISRITVSTHVDTATAAAAHAAARGRGWTLHAAIAAYVAMIAAGTASPDPTAADQIQHIDITPLHIRARNLGSQNIISSL